jgi:uroporphyrinogen-III synthase
LAPRPLHGRRVVVTRPAGQSAHLQQLLNDAGAATVELPLLQLVGLPCPPATATAAAPPDWVIAVSPSAVRFGQDWWAGPWPPACRVAGVGAGTARAWREAGHAAPLQPEAGQDSAALLEAPDLQAVTGQRIIIVRGEGGRDLLGPALRARGAVVDEWLCYRREPPPTLAADLQRLCLSPPAVDAWTLTSSEAVAHLDAAWPPDMPRAAPVFAPHPRIIEAARDAGWMTVLTPEGDSGLLAGLRTWFDDGHHD